ncbi:MAG TPA: hypothetical protein VFP37_06635 [Steroidobacteraceae bacterium]|nr:hypothetical protein [Steroidobacteraceae bacterium]
MAFALASTAVLAETPTAERSAVLQTRMALRDLWVEHVFWIRSYVFATHARDPLQEKAAEQEVVANARALAASIEPFYGQAATDGLFKLLAGHWDAVRSYNQATLAKSRHAQQQATTRIVNNAREIARFLSGANPYLPEDAVFGLLSSHGGHHIAQIDGVAARDFRAEAANWHAMRHHMLVISDAIVDALARQFPGQFQEAA